MLCLSLPLVKGERPSSVEDKGVGKYDGSNIAL